VNVFSSTKGTRRNTVWDLAYVLSLAFVFLGSLALTAVSIKRNRALIRSDGRYYYIWARSILLDHDIDFRNDYSTIRDPAEPLPPESAVRTPRGYVVNKYPVGMAVLEVPGLLLGHVVAHYVLPNQANGVSAPYQIATAWSLLLLYMVSFFLLYRAMLSLGAVRLWASSFCLMALVGTNLIHYVVREPAMAHAAGVAVFNVLVYLMVKWVDATKRVRFVHSILMGAVIGLLALIRSTNALLFPVLAALLWTRRRIRFSELMPMLGGAVVVASLQPVSLWFLWGRLRFSTYFNESFTSGLSGVLNTLTSARHGLLVYSPWYAILLLFVVYGAVVIPRLRRICGAAMVSFVLMAVANGTWWCWWFGSSFGNRAFVEILPALSLAAVLTVSWQNTSRRTTAALASVMLAAGALNLYLWAGYLLQAYPHDGSYAVGQAYLWLLSDSPASLIHRLAH
jgi:hypothetical protein